MAISRIPIAFLVAVLIAVVSVQAAPVNQGGSGVAPYPKARTVLDKLLASTSLTPEGRAYIEDAYKIDANISAYYLGDGKVKPTKAKLERRSGSGAASSATTSLLQSYPNILTSAYCNTSSITNWNCASCKKVTAPTNIKVTEVSDMQFFAAYFSSQNHIVVAFRGSKTLSNWISDLDIVFDSYSGTGAPSDVKVHGGFQDIYDEVKSTVRSYVNSLSSTYPSASITFGGHSLGGAIALFAALDLANTGYNSNLPRSKIRLITMGEPRSGNKAWGVWISQNQTWSLGLYRAVNYDDIVPHLPYEWTGYRHHQREYWIDSSGSLVTCDDVSASDNEDSNCADTQSYSTSTSSHLVYFGQTMGSSAC